MKLSLLNDKISIIGLARARKSLIDLNFVLWNVFFPKWKLELDDIKWKVLELSETQSVVEMTSRKNKIKKMWYTFWQFDKITIVVLNCLLVWGGHKLIEFLYTLPFKVIIMMTKILTVNYFLRSEKKSHVV